uniref:Uncharacterized protein n=1 Tax=Tetradesmus obliquus TaxID=3088 RepID=A0A383W3N9_TETOB|eukprot:jgi/Sobl393_1/1127/SZX72081.1
MCRQLAAIRRELPAEAASSTLLGAVLALEPGLQDLLQLHQQLPPLLQQLAPRNRGCHVTAAHRIRAAVNAAMQLASVGELLQCWSSLAGQGLLEDFRQAMQQAVLAAAVQDNSNSSNGHGGNAGAAGSSMLATSSSRPAAAHTSTGGSAAVASSAGAASGSSTGYLDSAAAAADSWEVWSGELLFGGLFDGGPAQLLQLLLQCGQSSGSSYTSNSSSSSSSCCWSPFVSFHLVPAALQQLLAGRADTQASADGTAQPKAAAAAAAAATALGGGRAGVVKADLLTASPEEQCQVAPSGTTASKQFAEDVVAVVRQWLLWQPAPSASSSRVAAAAACAGKQPQIATLYCAVEHLVRHCPVLQLLEAEHEAQMVQLLTAAAAAAAATADTGMLPTSQQQWRQQQLDATHTGQQQTGVHAAARSSRPSLLDHLLHVLAVELTAAVQQHGQLLQVLQAARVISCSCRPLLQQHYLQTLHQCIEADSCAAASAAAQSIQQRVCSSWETADVYVSAVLAIAAGSKGCSNLLYASCSAAGHGQQQLSGAAAGSTHSQVEQWQTVTTKRQRQRYSQPAALSAALLQQQQEHQQSAAGVKPAAADAAAAGRLHG